jgi:hypothetical protein
MWLAGEVGEGTAGSLPEAPATSKLQRRSHIRLTSTALEVN